MGGSVGTRARVCAEPTRARLRRSSGIGKMVRLLTVHNKETRENKKLAQALMEKWTRPIFGSSMQYSAAQVAPRGRARSAHSFRSLARPR